MEQLIAEGEHQQLDFKFEISDSRKIARSLVAFANTDGGKLLVGVKDNGAIAGVRSEEEYYMVEAAATMYCFPEIKFNSHEFNIQGKMVLEITVSKSMNQKYKAPDKNNEPKYYVRVGDQNLLAHPIQIQVWKLNDEKKQAKFCITKNERFVLNYLINNPVSNYTTLIEAMGLSKFKINSILAYLVYFGVISIRMTEKELSFILNGKMPDIESLESFKID
ncbi:MAG: ATP-binding protein [Bacteroidales bacterium]|nr:ATP-binding protein [Bacteroidales bacterium]